MTNLSKEEFSICGILFLLKEELKVSYEYFNCGHVINYLNLLEETLNEVGISFDMDILIETLEDKYKLSKLFADSSYKQDYILFYEAHKFIRTGWMSSTKECGHEEYCDDENISDCNWKSSTEECEGIYVHDETYGKLIHLVFGK